METQKKINQIMLNVDKNFIKEYILNYNCKVKEIKIN